jgi:multidrug efflux system outer membrane protein
METINIKRNKLYRVKLFTLLLNVFIAGCGLFGPDYNKPQLETNDTWRSKGKNTENDQVNLPQIAWWKKFNDPVLNGLINQAISHNNNIEIAKSNLLVAQATLSQVEMNWVPTISLGASAATGQAFNNSFTNTSGNPALGMIHPNNPQGFGFSGIGLIPSYTLNVFGQINQQNIAKLSVKMQEQVINAVKLAVISQVAGSYFTLLGLHKQLYLQQKMIADAKELRKYNLIKNKLGQADNLQIIAIEQYISSMEAQVPQIQHNIVQVENTLQVLTDHNPESITTLGNFDNINADGIVPVNLPSTVLNNRPDIAIAEYQIKLANASIGLARSQYFPTISLTTPIGAGSGSLSKLFSGGTDFWATQISAGLPLLNLGLAAEIDKSKAQQKVAYYNYVLAVRTAFADVDSSLSQNDSLRKVAREQLISLAKAQDIQKNIKTKYKLGAVSYSDTIGTKLDVDYVKANNNQTKIQQMGSIVKLYQSLGGGYEAKS